MWCYSIASRMYDVCIPCICVWIYKLSSKQKLWIRIFTAYVCTAIFTSLQCLRLYHRSHPGHSTVQHSDLGLGPYYLTAVRLECSHPLDQHPSIRVGAAGDSHQEYDHAFLRRDLSEHLRDAEAEGSVVPHDLHIHILHHADSQRSLDQLSRWRYLHAVNVYVCGQCLVAGRLCMV